MNQPMQLQLRPTDIKIVSDTAKAHVESEIKKLLAEGYLFHGDLKVAQDENYDIHFIQAMVKVEPVQPSRVTGVQNIVLPA